MRLSVTIMAHPERALEAYQLRDSLDHPARIVFDPEPVSKESEQRWENGLKAWEMHDSFADYHLVLQDDAVVSWGLVDGASKALAVLGRSGFMSLFTGRARPMQTEIADALSLARVEGHHWVAIPGLRWGVAIAAPVWTIPEMLSWASKRQGVSYTARIGNYYQNILGWRCWYPYPSLVDHRDELPSLIGRQHRGRAEEMASDATKVIWSVPPPGFHPLIDPTMKRFVR